jgi:hypothetical protein
MRVVSNFLAAALVAVAFAALAAAAGMNSVAAPGGAWSPSDGGPVLPQNGGGGAPPPGPSGPGPGYRGPSSFTPRSPTGPSGPSGAFTPPHPGPTPPGLWGRGPGPGSGPGPNQRRRPRHYWLGNGPIFVPQPSGDYIYGDEDYDDGADPAECWVYRKIYDRSGHFLGWAHINTCEGQ